MTSEDRDNFADGFLIDCHNLLFKKGQEYSVDGDVNGNFKRVAAEQGLSPLQVWNTYFQKHLDSIRNYIKNPDMPLTEPIEGRLMDAINYLVIFAALLQEEKDIDTKNKENL